MEKNTQVTELGGDMKGVEIRLGPDLDGVEIAQADQVTERLPGVVLGSDKEGRLASIGLERREGGNGGVAVVAVIGVFGLDGALERFEVAGTDGGEERLVGNEPEVLRVHVVRVK